MHGNTTIVGTIIIDGPPEWVGSFLDWPTAFGQWTTDLPNRLARLWDVAGALWWPWLPLLLLAAVVGTVTVRLVAAVLWRRAATGGYWVQIIPPRTVDAARWGLVWRRLDALAVRARRGRWHLVRPPLAFEVFADGRGLSAGAVAARLGAAAGGGRRHRPGLARRYGAPRRPAHPRGPAGSSGGGRGSARGWLVDDPRPRTGTRRGVGTDPDLGMVFAALGDPDTEGAQVLLVQVLVRPVPARRMKRLATAALQPMQDRRGGMRTGADALLWLLQGAIRVVLAVLDVFLSSGNGSSSPSSSRPAGRQAPDPIEREAMAEAKAKRQDRPHLLASVRVFAAGARRGSVRQAARSVGDGYGEASRWLRPVRLRRARSMLRARRARRDEWLWLSANELGVLAHLPPDPALYRFDTAAVHRPFPGGASRARPEAGWTRQGWTETSHADDPESDEGDDVGDDIDPHHPKERYEYE